MIDRVTLTSHTAARSSPKVDTFRPSKGETTAWDTVELTPDQAVRDLERVGRLFGGTDEHLTRAGELIAGEPELKATGITPHEVAAIRSYTSGLFEHVNPLLRGNQNRFQKALKWGSFGLYSKALDAGCRLVASGLNRLPSYRDKDVYRAVYLPEEALAAYTPGREVTEKSFTSCSKSPDHTRPGDALFVIRSRDAKDVSKVSYNAHEEEVLFLPETRFRVLDRVEEKTRFGTIPVIYMEQV